MGLATVENLLKANAYVAVLDLRPPPTSRIAESTSKLKFFQTDITKVEDIEKAVDGTVKWAQETGVRLGGVVNCAGVGTAAKVRGLLACSIISIDLRGRNQALDFHGEPHPLDLWNFAIQVNLTGTFNLTRLACKHLAQVEPEGPDGERGVAIMVASSAAVRFVPYTIHIVLYHRICVITHSIRSKRFTV